ncbi:hypothetical protein ACWGH2_37165 [Streptomyces sp. NPDC054871]
MQPEAGVFTAGDGWTSEHDADHFDDRGRVGPPVRRQLRIVLQVAVRLEGRPLPLLGGVISDEHDAVGAAPAAVGVAVPRAMDE